MTKGEMETGEYQASQWVSELTGYSHPGYAQSLDEFGVPRPLGCCLGWILQRRIPNTPLWDAMGCYPLFTCRDWTQLKTDLSLLQNKLVSFSAVLDPFGNYDESLLRQIFPDRLVKFKEHFVADLTQRPVRFVCRHHRRNARKALQQVRVEVVSHPAAHLNEWLELYSHLVQRHAIGDIRKFSRCAFNRQLKMPGCFMFRAVHEGIVVGMLLFFAEPKVVYYHLGAYSADGYRLNVSFALFWAAIGHFAQLGFRWLNLGAGAGTSSDDSDGLTRFKRGWATGTRTAYFGGKILDHEAYARLARGAPDPMTQYFPAYRQGEFCKKPTTNI